MRKYGLEQSIKYYRGIQAEAKAERETCTDPDLLRYLKARADQAGCEAAAMEASVRDWKAKDSLTAEIAGAEARFLGDA